MLEGQSFKNILAMALHTLLVCDTIQGANYSPPNAFLEIILNQQMTYAIQNYRPSNNSDVITVLNLELEKSNNRIILNLQIQKKIFFCTKNQEVRLLQFALWELNVTNRWSMIFISPILKYHRQPERHNRPLP